MVMSLTGGPSCQGRSYGYELFACLRKGGLGVIERLISKGCGGRDWSELRMYWSTISYWYMELDYVWYSWYTGQRPATCA